MAEEDRDTIRVMLARAGVAPRPEELDTLASIPLARPPSMPRPETEPQLVQVVREWRRA